MYLEWPPAGLTANPGLPDITGYQCVLYLAVVPKPEPHRSHRLHYSSRGVCLPYPLTRHRREVLPAFAASGFLRVGSMQTSRDLQRTGTGRPVEEEW